MSLARALAPFGIAVSPEVLRLWRDQHGHGGGVFWQAERGDTSAIDEAVRMLLELRGPDVDEAPPGAD